MRHGTDYVSDVRIEPVSILGLWMHSRLNVAQMARQDCWGFSRTATPVPAVQYTVHWFQPRYVECAVKSDQLLWAVHHINQALALAAKAYYMTARLLCRLLVGGHHDHDMPQVNLPEISASNTTMDIIPRFGNLGAVSVTLPSPHFKQAPRAPRLQKLSRCKTPLLASTFCCTLFALAAQQPRIRALRPRAVRAFKRRTKHKRRQALCAATAFFKANTVVSTFFTCASWTDIGQTGCTYR
jgi:hypothetical protein